MVGLLPQMHRNEQVITGTVSFLMKNAYGIDYTPQNVPNKYLRQVNGENGENTSGIGR